MTNDTKMAAVVAQVDRRVRPLVEAETVRALKTADFYVLMVRYGPDYWAAHTTHRDLETATRQADSVNPGKGHDDWRIVRVAGLPIHVAAGEAA